MLARVHEWRIRTVEIVRFASHHNLKGFVVIIAAVIANGHRILRYFCSCMVRSRFGRQSAFPLIVLVFLALRTAMVGKIAFKLVLPLAITFSLFLMFERPFAVAISAVSGGSFLAIACVHRGNSFVYLQERRGGPVGSWLRACD